MRIAVVGIGNRQRGDDAAGLAVIDLLAADPPAGSVELIHAGEDLLGLGQRLRGFDAAILVDAMVSGSPRGQVRRFDGATPGSDYWPRFASTHSVDLATALGLARVLGDLPPTVVLFGIEAADFTHGADPARGLSTALAEACNRIRSECRSLQNRKA